MCGSLAAAELANVGSWDEKYNLVQRLIDSRSASLTADSASGKHLQSSRAEMQMVADIEGY